MDAHAKLFARPVVGLAGLVVGWLGGCAGLVVCWTGWRVRFANG